jgi:hypothetical protein
VAQSKNLSWLDPKSLVTLSGVELPTDTDAVVTEVISGGTVVAPDCCFW